MMSFILGSLVSAPSVYAPAGGAALLAEQVAEIEDIIRRMQDQLDNIRVTWDRVDAKPLTLLEMSCRENQIGKWDRTQWVCTDEITGPSGSTEFVIKLSGLTQVTEIYPSFKLIKEFKITGLPSSTSKYQIPINLIQLGANMKETGAFQIEFEESSDVDFPTSCQCFFIAADGPNLTFKSYDHIQANKEHITIDANKTEKFFRLIGRSFVTDDTGSFDNLKFVMSLPLPEGATIEEIIPPI